MLSGKSASAAWAVSNAFIDVRHSIRMSSGIIEVEEVMVLARNGGMAMRFLNVVVVFLASVGVELI